MSSLLLLEPFHLPSLLGIPKEVARLGSRPQSLNVFSAKTWFAGFHLLCDGQRASVRIKTGECFCLGSIMVLITGFKVHFFGSERKRGSVE